MIIHTSTVYSTSGQCARGGVDNPSILQHTQQGTFIRAGVEVAQNTILFFIEFFFSCPNYLIVSHHLPKSDFIIVVHLFVLQEKQKEIQDNEVQLQAFATMRFILWSICIIVSKI